MKKFGIILFLLLCVFTLPESFPQPLSPRIKIRNHIFRVEIADTPEQRAKGLSYRDTMPFDCGMLFVFKEKARYTFWMKGMRFPLDFLWIDGNRIVDITEKVPLPAGETLPVYSPRIPVNRVLELNAGVVENLGISIGDTLVFLK